MSCEHNESVQRCALMGGMCPLCLGRALHDLLAILDSPEWRRTELAAYLYGYRCPPKIALANADTIARAKDLLT